MKSLKMKIANYEHSYYAECLRLFDENCPQYFAENEKQDYVHFLDSDPVGYFMVVETDTIIAAFGLLISSDKTRARLSWILVSSSAKGKGVGKAMMTHVQQLAGKQAIATIDIAASHLSAAFFAKFGAVTISELPDGWGKGMHRVDMELEVLQ